MSQNYCITSLIEDITLLKNMLNTYRQNHGGWHHHSSVSPNSPTEDSLIHTTPQSSRWYSEDLRCPSYPRIVKRQWVFAAFASLYGCILVTTSAAKLLENQRPEAWIRGCMTLTVTKNWSWFACECFNV